MLESQRILIIRQGGIGDILFTLPVTYMLKDTFPNCRLTFLTKKAFVPLLEGFPAIDDIIAIDSDAFNSRSFKKICQNTISLFRKIRRERYHLVVDLHGIEKTALITGLTGAEKRWGIIRKKFSRKFYTVSQSIPEDLHRIDLNLLLLEKGGLQKLPIKNSFILPAANFQKAQALWNEWGLSQTQPTLFIQPFTNFQRKNWPLEHYYAVAEFCKTHNIQVVFGGGPADRENLHQVALDFPVAAGRADFLTTAGLMKLSTLVLGGDTGMLHLAVALGKKVLMLMDGTESRKFYPYQHPEWALIPENSFRISDLSTERVIQLTNNMLE